ncbi:Solute carrier family 12 member 2 [Armadillidium vulgare]|nr:Solute carrier family 12 member 2 [Armadillidium vulgare]
MSETGSYASSRKSSANSDVIDARGGSYLELRSKKKTSPKHSPKKTVFKWKGSDDLVSSDVIENMKKFKLKQPAGTIDVWWLFDDGGLTLLLPYILTTRTLWQNCKLRIFCLCSKRGDLETEHRKMSELIRKFRIDISDVIMIEDIHKRPKEESMMAFNALIDRFREKKEEEEKEESSEREIDKDLLICEDEMKLSQDKTRRQVRLKELLLEHSSQASLIVMTLPVPTKGRIPAPLYMAWLETLTKDLPPFLLVRGNQSSVLTFYS